MNRKIGMVSSLVTLLAVASFALCMLVDSDAGSYLSSMFIAWGYLPMACAFAARAKEEARAAALTGVAFAAIYGALIAVVYFAQLTAVRLSPLSEEALNLLDYTRFGLFFSLDLLGYGFMALSTFFMGLTISPRRACGPVAEESAHDPRRLCRHLRGLSDARRFQARHGGRRPHRRTGAGILVRVFSAGVRAGAPALSRDYISPD